MFLGRTCHTEWQRSGRLFNQTHCCYPSRTGSQVAGAVSHHEVTFLETQHQFLHSQSVLHPPGVRKHEPQNIWASEAKLIVTDSSVKQLLELPPAVWWLDLCCVWARGSFIRPGQQQLTKADHSASPWSKGTLHRTAAGQPGVVRAEASHASLDLHQPLKNKDWEEKRLGRKLCWLHSHRGNFIWDWKTLWRGTPSRNYYQMSAPSRCFWSVPVRWCARERECV